MSASSKKSGPPLELSESLEDYLETIFHIVTEKRVARVKEIAHHLEISNSSVTGALRTLVDKGLINYAPYDVVTLTGHGEQLAEEIVHRHHVLRDFFVKILHLEEAEANRIACRMEHFTSKQVVDKLVQFVQFLDTCPLTQLPCAQKRPHCPGKPSPQACQKCVTEVMKQMQVTPTKKGH